MIDIKDIFINFTITFVAYMGFPLYKFGIKKEINDLKLRKKIIFWNSVIAAILFIIMRSILYGIEYGVRTFAPALLYYTINLLLYTKSNKLVSKKGKEKIMCNNEIFPKTENKVKTMKKNNNFSLIYLTMICITIFLSVGIYSYANYQKEQLKQEQANERLKIEQNAYQTRQKQLQNCIKQANSDRTNLWNNNCAEQENGSCSIKQGTGTIEWIEQRYQQDLNNCYQLYGK